MVDKYKHLACLYIFKFGSPSVKKIKKIAHLCICKVRLICDEIGQFMSLFIFFYFITR